MSKTADEDKHLPYFVHPIADALVIGGFSVLLFLLLKAFRPEGAPSAQYYSLVGALTWVVNHPHFSATNHRLYGSRAHIRQFPVTALLIPVLVFAATIGAFLAPAEIAPAFVKFFLIWSPYHFSGQTIGITLLYAYRQGFQVSAPLRFAISAFVYSTFLYSSARGEVGRLSYPYHGIDVPVFGLSDSLATGLHTFMIGAGVVALLLFAHAAWTHRRLPWILLVPPTTQLVWFIFASGFQGYYELVPFFHSLQYLFIAWAVQLKERLDTHALEPSAEFVCRESLRWGAINFVGGATLFIGLPHLLAACGASSLPFAIGVFTAAVQIHHFFVDGVIWKIRNPNLVSPMLVHIDDLIRPNPAPLGAAV